MKVNELLCETFAVPGITWYFPRRSKEVENAVLKPFQKKVADEMRRLRGKWNGSGYDFKTDKRSSRKKASLHFARNGMSSKLSSPQAP